MSDFWNKRNVLVTGGAGFIGSRVVELLLERNTCVRVVDNLENGTLENLKDCIDSVEFMNGDLKEIEICQKACADMDVVINAAAKVGGIDYNAAHPGDMFYTNVLLTLNMLEAARLKNVERFLVVSSACVYRHLCTIPTPETEGFIGDPEPTNFGYGWAKRLAEVNGKTYADEYGMKLGIVRPYNAYGPRDHFEPEKSHVIPAIINRLYGGENPLTVWGNGEQSRAFLFVDDFARGLIEAIERYPVPDPVNIGTDEEIKIKDLVRQIIEISGKDVDIFFDTSKPSGQPRRNCDTRKAKEKIGFTAKVPLREGLTRMIRWYEENIAKNR
jgi:GDP-L-fucose synthase